jgi:hypothetical protein
MMTSNKTTRTSPLSLTCLLLSVAGCGQPLTVGDAVLIDPASMDALYYGIDGRPHPDMGHRAADAQPTLVGRSGAVVALATTIYNRPPFGAIAQLSICDGDGRVLETLTVPTPGRVEITGLLEGEAVHIRPETVGTMAKLLTPEQIAGGSP